MYLERNKGPLAKKINWLVVSSKNLKENLAISTLGLFLKENQEFTCNCCKCVSK